MKDKVLAARARRKRAESNLLGMGALVRAGFIAKDSPYYLEAWGEYREVVPVGGAGE